MNPLRKLFSLLIISLGISVCAQSQGECQKDYGPASEDLNRFSPLSPLNDPLLLKAAITVFGEYYSGLVLIKQMPADSAIHIAMLSELGLSLMDLSYRNDEFTVHNVQEFLNRRSLLSTLQNDFRCLLLDLSHITDYRISCLSDGTGEELKFRHRSQRYLYKWDPVSGPGAIRKRKALFGRVDIQVSGAAKGQSGSEILKIGIRHRGIRLKIELTELNQL